MENIEKFGPRESIKSRTEYDILKADVDRLEGTLAMAAEQAGANKNNPSPKLEADIQRYHELLERYEGEHPEEFNEETNG